MPRSPATGGYTGPAVHYSAEDRRRIEQFKALRAAEHDPARWREMEQISQQLEVARAALSPMMRARALQEARIEAGLERHRLDAPGPVLSAQASRDKMTATLRGLFAGKKIATRMSAEALAQALADGRFKTQFETGASGLPGAYVPEERARAEEQLFGIPQRGFDPKKRPYYGYVLLSGEQAAPADDVMLNVYGPIEVVLRDRVRQRTTAMIGDSLNDIDRARPSPVNDPQFWSFKPTRLRPGDFDHDVTGADFRGGDYAEAQIHGGISIDDVREVVFPAPPQPDLVAALDAADVPWRVVRAKAVR